MPEIMDRPQIKPESDEENNYDASTLMQDEAKLDITNSNFDNEKDLLRWLHLSKKATQFGRNVFPEEEKKELEELNNRAEAVVYARKHSIDIDRIDDILRPLTWEENKKLMEINRQQINRDLTKEENRFRSIAQARIDLHGMPKPDYDTEENNTIN